MVLESLKLRISAIFLVGPRDDALVHFSVIHHLIYSNLTLASLPLASLTPLSLSRPLYFSPHPLLKTASNPAGTFNLRCDGRRCYQSKSEVVIDSDLVVFPGHLNEPIDVTKFVLVNDLVLAEINVVHRLVQVHE